MEVAAARRSSNILQSFLVQLLFARRRRIANADNMNNNVIVPSDLSTPQWWNLAARIVAVG